MLAVAPVALTAQLAKAVGQAGRLVAVDGEPAAGP
jgi:hypothetical protein